MKRMLALVLSLSLLMVMALALPAQAEEKTVYPDGTVSVYCTGQPQFLQMYFDEWLERNRDIAPGVKIELVQVETMAAGRQKISMDYLAGAYDDMPDAVYLDAVGIVDLASAGCLPTFPISITPSRASLWTARRATRPSRQGIRPARVRPSPAFVLQRGDS